MMGHGYTGGEMLRPYREKRNRYWEILRMAQKDANKLNGRILNSKEFQKFLKDTYGIQPKYDNNGNYSAEYTVIDEKKYLLLLLKYGSV